MAARTKQIDLHCQTCQSRNSSMFSDLSGTELDTISSHKSCVAYKKGQVLFYEGTRPMGLFCINRGKVKVSKVGSNGKEQILFISKPGDFLGYRSLLGEEFYGKCFHFRLSIYSLVHYTIINQHMH